MTFTQRRIDVTISLGEGENGDKKGEEVTLSGYRVSADIPSHTQAEKAQLKLEVYGLNQEMMCRLMAIGPKAEERRKNFIRVSAGSVSHVPCEVVYEGDILQASANHDKAPESVFTVTAQVAGVKEVQPVPPRQYPSGKAGAHEVMRSIATSMGFDFEKNGKDLVLANPYFPGTATEQLNSCAKAARVHYTIDRGVLAVWPEAGCRNYDPIEISPENGLIWYPAFTSSGLLLRTLYNSDLSIGKRVQVTSSIEAAQGSWTIVSLSHKLQTEVPDGSWLSQIVCKRNLNG